MSESKGKEYQDVVCEIVRGIPMGGKHIYDLTSENGTKIEVKGSNLFPHNSDSATPDWVWNGCRMKLYDQFVAVGRWDWRDSYIDEEYRFFDFRYDELVEFSKNHGDTIRCAPEKGWSPIRRFVLQHEVPKEVLQLRYCLRRQD